MSGIPTGLSRTITQPRKRGECRSTSEKIKSLYGLTEPFDFGRAIPLVAALVMLFVATAAAVIEAYVGKMHWGTFRFLYFVYLGSTAIAAAALSFKPRLAWALIALCFIEFSVAISTAALARLEIFDLSMLPPDSSMSEFKYHPLLQAVPTPNFTGLDPARVSSEFSASAAIKVHHNRLGMRGPERDTARLRQQIVIAAVGGSTTYDLGVADGQTWPDVLERDLGSNYAVLNHGVSGYSTSEHLIQTLFYLDAYDVTPRCAIYYVGWNDVRLAHLPHLDPGYAGFDHLQKIDVLQVRKTPLAAEISPLARIATRYLQSWLDTLPRPESVSGLPPGEGSDSRLEKIYRRNIEAIAAINQARGITSLFVGQVLNRAKLSDTKSNFWSPLIRDDQLWPLQEHFNEILRQAAEETGSPVFIPPIDQFEDSDFVDRGHFSWRGSAKFANFLAPLVHANCTRPAADRANSPRAGE